MRVGERIRSWRNAAGLSQWDLAKKIATGPQFISNLETGRLEPSPATLQKIAWALGVSDEDSDTVALMTGNLPWDLVGEIKLQAERGKRLGLENLLEAFYFLRAGIEDEKRISSRTDPRTPGRTS